MRDLTCARDTDGPLGVTSIVLGGIVSSEVRSAIAAKDPLLTYDQAAELMNVSARMVRRLTSERRMEFVKVGRHVRVPMSAAEKYVREHTVPALRGYTGV